MTVQGTPEDQAHARQMKRWLAFGAIGLVLAVVVFGPGSRENAEQAEAAQAQATQLAASPPIETGAEAMVEAYNANEVAAAEQFASGRRVQVSGMITAIGLNDVGEPWLALDGASVLAVLPETARSAVAKLAKGEAATVICAELLRMDAVLRLDRCELAARE